MILYLLLTELFIQNLEDFSEELLRMKEAAKNEYFRQERRDVEAVL